MINTQQQSIFLFEMKLLQDRREYGRHTVAVDKQITMALSVPKHFTFLYSHLLIYTPHPFRWMQIFLMNT